MGQFNDRIFGANIHPSIKNKLKAKQIFAQSSEPNESLLGNNVFTKLDNLGNEEYDSNITAADALGGINFSRKNGEDSIADLSSRTPWVRMWSAVQLFYFEKGGDEQNEYTSKLVTTNEGLKGGIRSQEWYKKRGIFHKEYQDVLTKKQIKKDLQTPLEGKVYTIGNHVYNNISETNNPMSPIFNLNSTDNSSGESVSDFGAGQASNFFRNEMSTNEYLKPPAGITSVSSETAGTVGAIKMTTVNFIVHNFTDFENIYLKYFLKPGAFVVVDFGWDTSGIYDPYREIVEQDKPIRELIYGDSGVIVNSKGDLEVVIGQVVDYSAKAREDGGFDCSIQIKSSNESLLDKELTDRNRLRSKFVSGISSLIINRAARFLGKSFLRNDWNSSTDNLEESREYANTFGEQIYGGGPSNVVDISNLSLASGVYWQALDEKGKTIRGSNNIYVSWGFFEEEILNKDLALNFGESFQAKFNSSNTFITYESNLVKRQNIDGSLSSDKTDLKFLYPPNWDRTFFTINKKKYGYNIPKRPEGIQTPSYSVNVNVDGKSDSDLDKDANRIPLRELFINLSVIKDAFSSTNTVNDAIKQMLDVINEDSYNVFNLKLASGTRDFSTLAVVDTNRVSIKNDEGDNLFQHMFVFNPYSSNSIVKSMDLSYNTPKGGLQNMLAIQNTDPNIPIFANSEDEHSNQVLRQLLHQSLGKKGIGMRYLPELQTDFSDKDGSWETVYEDGVGSTDQDKAIFEKNIEDENTIDTYKSILAESGKSKALNEDGVLSDGAEDLKNYELDLKKGKENPPPKTNEEENSVDPTVIYAKNLEEYYGYKCKQNFIEPKVPTPLPINLTLTTYGISNIVPGDIFTIDYLPKTYGFLTYFQTMKVSHDLTPETWSTTLETVMRIKPNKKDLSIYKRPKKIMLTPSFFTNIISSRATELFTDFDITEESVGDVIVVKCRGKENDESFNWLDEKGNFPDNLYDSLYMNTFFNLYFNSTVADNSNVSFDGYGEYKNQRYSLWNEHRELNPIEKGKLYYFLIFLGGGIPIQTGPISIKTYATAINEAIQHSKLYKMTTNALGDLDGFVKK